MNWPYGKLLLVAVFMCVQWTATYCQNQLTPEEINNIFLDLFVEHYGESNVVTEEQLQPFFPKTKAESFTPEASLNCSYLSAADAKECFKDKCLSSSDIYDLHDAPPAGADSTDILGMCGSILYQVNNPNCLEEKSAPHESPSKAETWGYGFLCVTAISLCSLGGILFIGVMNTQFWKRFMMFMVALAVGTLAGSGILVLIPEAYELHHEDNPHHHDYLWIASTIMCGVYLFFLSEKVLKIITKPKKKSAKQPTIIENKSVELTGVQSIKGDVEKNGVNGIVNGSFQPNGEAIFTSLQEIPNKTVLEQEDKDILSKIGKIKSVAWMVVFGDALHNFIDGLAIGAAFVESTLTGISVSLAVFCEELPHELGDFAILLNSGMSMRMALFCNFFSACTCYLGLIIGINIGELTSGGQWIFAIAGGMFLYISLADMLPEMNQAADEEEEESGTVWVAFLIQNVGIIVGFCIILVMSVYGGDISFD